MTRTFIQTDEFLKNWQKLGLSDDDLRRLEYAIMMNPKVGSVIPGTGKLRKMRFAYENRGKSGTAWHIGKRVKGGMVMSSVYESIMAGLTEAIGDVQSTEKKLKRRAVTIIPVKEYEASEIKAIRKSTGLSQKLFAGYMGVSDKTVEAWESGKNKPSGVASRLLTMMEMDADLTTDFPFVKIEEHIQ